MKQLCERILNRAQLLGAVYADVRVLQIREQTVRVGDGRVRQINDCESNGFGVRVLVERGWGFASSSLLTGAEADRVVETAVSNAHAAALISNTPIVLPPGAAVTGEYRTPIEIDPFSVPVQDKIDLLLRADAGMRIPGIAQTRAGVEAVRKLQLFASTEGSFITQEIYETGGGMQCTAVGEGEVQQRSYPNRFGRDRSTIGWEYVVTLDLEKNGPRIASQALELLKADRCPPGVTTVILDGSQLALTLHETFGHGTEADRIMELEASLAGGSFLKGKKLGEFRVGSPLVNITADATTPGGMGTFGYDDEGIPAQRVPLIRAGIFVGIQANRQEAASCGVSPTGSARAAGWMSTPLTRMTNINLEPGDWRFEDLIADTEEGIYMELCRSLSIDTQRYNFQFGSEIAWEIKHGRLGRVFKNPTFTGLTPAFWESCDAVCNRDYFKVWSTDCGKGQPSQNVNVGHGTVPARFRGVRVGVIK